VRRILRLRRLSSKTRIQHRYPDAGAADRDTDPDADAGPDQHADEDADQHADADEHADADLDADRNSDQHADECADEHADADPDADRDSDEHTDEYADQHADSARAADAVRDDEPGERRDANDGDAEGDRGPERDGHERLLRVRDGDELRKHDRAAGDRLRIERCRRQSGCRRPDVRHALSFPGCRDHVFHDDARARPDLYDGHVHVRELLNGAALPVAGHTEPFRPLGRPCALERGAPNLPRDRSL
jgi:hypothetical protein